MHKAIIIDDEEMARTLLKGMLEEYCKNIQVVDTCKDLPSGVKSIHKNKPDIVFLDIEMPGHSGLELLDFFNEEEINFSIIFVTAYNKYAIQAFKLSAVDYLLKPIEIDDLTKAVSLFEKKKEKQHYQILKNNFTQKVKKIAIPTASSIKYIELDNILFLKADGAYTTLTLKDSNTIVVSKGLKYFEDALSEFEQFCRCHKSYIVNTKHISEHIKSDGGYLIVDNKHQISLSPEKSAEINHLINTVK
jgi:two-component system LytT family response regulator